MQLLNNGFEINGKSFDRDELCLLAHNFLIEGTVHEKEIGSFILEWFNNDLFVETNTSGTTGIAKAHRIEKKAMINSAKATASFFNIQTGDRILLCMSTKYIAGKMMLVRAFVLGLNIDFSEPNFFPLLLNNNIYDFCAMVPMQVKNSLDKLKNIKKLIIGGAAVNYNLRKELLKLDTDIYETYGMTETVTHIAAKKIGENNFTTLPDIKISLDERNCLVIYAPKVSNDKVITNDIVEIINERQFCFIGRIDNVVNSGGIKLFPEQIEEKLCAHISARFFVGGINDEMYGEKLVLVIEGMKYDFDYKIFDVLDKYEKPKEVIFVEIFDETESKKIKRGEIFKNIQKNI